MKIYDIKESGKRIKELRKAEGLSQEDLADKMGVERSFISLLETGQRGCSIDVAIRLSEILNSSLDYIVLGISQTELAKKELDNTIQRLSELRDAM